MAKSNKMDFSGFEKISTSGKKTTLKHKQGHFMVLAHNALKPEHRKALEALPFAKGGKVKNPKAVEMSPARPVSYKEQAASKNPTVPRSGVRPQDAFPEKYNENGDRIPEPRRVMKDGGKPEDAPLDIEKIDELPQAVPDQVTINSLPPDRSAPPPQETAPLEVEKVDPAAAMQSSDPTSQPQVEAVAPPATAPVEKAPAAPPQAPPSISQQMIQERNNTAQDLMEGQIHPKTYQDLYNSKDTLGKIGTLIGLMIGGAGSGLSGQPNALLGMMDKIIDRDLDAQKTSASNRQNFYKIRQTQQMNEALIKHYAAQNGLTDAQAAETFAKAGLANIDLKQARAAMHDMGAPPLSPADDAKITAQAKMDMQSAMLHDMDRKVQKMPDGTQKQNAIAALQHAGAKIINEDHPAAAAAVENAHNTQGTSDEQKASGVLQEKKEANHLLRPDAEKLYTRALYDPIIRKNPALASELEEQYQAAQQADKATDAVVDSFDKLKGLRGWGVRAAQAVSPTSLGALGASLGAGLGGTQGAEAGGAAGAAIGSLFPTTDAGRQYDAEKAKLQGLIGNALSAAKLTPTEVTHMIDKYAPVAGDSPDTLDTKLDAILDKIRLSMKTTRLQRAKMTR